MAETKATVTFNVALAKGVLDGKLSAGVRAAGFMAKRILAVDILGSAKKRTGRVYKYKFPFVFGDPDELDILYETGHIPKDLVRWRPHQASAPGESPASDNGILKNSFQVELLKTDSGKATARLVSNLVYAKALELGSTRKMPLGGSISVAPRPYLSLLLTAQHRERIVAEFIRRARDYQSPLKGTTKPKK